MLLQRDVFGQRARWERYTANLLYVIASGQKIDENRAPQFGELLDEVYANPFEERIKEPTTTAEITAKICDDIKTLLAGMEEDNGSVQPCGEDHAG